MEQNGKLEFLAKNLWSTLGLAKNAWQTIIFVWTAIIAGSAWLSKNYIRSIPAFSGYPDGAITSILVLSVMILALIPALCYMYAVYLSEVRSKKTYRDCEIHFRGASIDNCTTDAGLFASLFSEVAIEVNKTTSKSDKVLIPIRRQVVVSTDHARQLIQNNLQNTLNSAAEILSTYTGHRVSVSLKLIDTVDGAVEVFDRDRLSQNGRGPMIQSRNETPFKDVTKQGQSYQLDDIAGWTRKQNNGIVYSDTEWAAMAPAPYNSILVVPVMSAVPVRFTASNATSSARDVKGYLQADTFDKGLANPTCYHYLCELSWRISVLYYRILALDQYGKASNE